MTRWDLGRFGVERRCDCSKGQRAAECRSSGWHLVDSSDDFGAAVASSVEIFKISGAEHRVIDRPTDVAQ